MVCLFDVPELQGQPLLFGLKMNEAKIILAVKTTTISILFKNRALDNSIDHSDQQIFSVESERNMAGSCFPNSA